MTRVVAGAGIWLLTLAGALAQSRYAGTLDQHAAIDYRGGMLSDVVTVLARDIKAGTTRLAFDGQAGFLRSLLEQLHVPVESQLLLFSKTGIQNAHTSPETPRALYFNDRVIVGYIPGATVLESDIAALLVFDHQGRAINLLTRLGWEVRIAAGEGRRDFSTGDLRAVLHETVDYLLFVDEAKLTAPVHGVSTFSKTFAATGPRDRRGRSLREFELQTRLFKYRCSYMIYSPAFDALPGDARAAVLAQMRERITDPETIAILDETKPGWR